MGMHGGSQQCGRVATAQALLHTSLLFHLPKSCLTGHTVQAMMGIIVQASGEPELVNNGAEPQRPRDSVAQQQALVTLQKLSLLRAAQSEMISMGAVKWAVDFLQVKLVAHTFATVCERCPVYRKRLPQ